jgi:hypothetical protein
MYLFKAIGELALGTLLPLCRHFSLLTPTQLLLLSPNNNHLAQGQAFAMPSMFRTPVLRVGVGISTSKLVDQQICHGLVSVKERK